MEDKVTQAFNLLYEPWIVVRKPSGDREEISILSLFQNADTYLSLSGELPAQDATILRLLLAIMHSVFRDFKDAWDALDTWKKLWDAGRFPYEKIESYLKQHEDRFWLIHPEQPFFQAPGLDKRADAFGPFGIAKLNGELSESDNKIRLFQHRSGDEKTSLSFSEAARWLLYFNGYAETFGKLEVKCKTNKSDPSVGVGWLGKLGLITAVGANLFETIMLNFVLLNYDDALWESGKPIWEKPVSLKERNAIVLPKNQSELLTLQSRRILLESNGDRIVAYRFVSGDIFPQEEAFAETMTTWRYSKQPGDKEKIYRPKPFQQSVQLWRDCPSLMSQKDDHRLPGVVKWLQYLREEIDDNGDSILPIKLLRFQTSGIAYGTMQAVITDVFSDSIAFNSALLTELHKDWIPRIITELNVTDNLVREVGTLAQNIAKASGDAEGLAARNEAKSQAYFRLDQPFRQWLESIEPEVYCTGEMTDKKCGEWWETSKAIVRSLGKEIVNSCSLQAFIGRNNLSAPQAFSWFIYNTANRETLKEKIEKGGKKIGKPAKSSA